MASYPLGPAVFDRFEAKLQCSRALEHRLGFPKDEDIHFSKWGGALWHISNNISLGGGSFKCLIFSLYIFGEDFQFDYIILFRWLETTNHFFWVTCCLAILGEEKATNQIMKWSGDTILGEMS